MRSEFSSRGLVVCAMNVNLNVNASGPDDAVEVLFHDFPRDDADFLMFVGVDGGGTSTECLVEVVDGTESDGIVFTTVRSRTGPANANSVGFDQAFANVSNAVFRAVDRAIAECLDLTLTSPAKTTCLFQRGLISTFDTTFGAGSPKRKGTKHKAGRARRLRLAGVTLGIAGCDSPADKKVWRDKLLLPFREDVPGECSGRMFAPETLVVENDAVVALARATNGAARGGALLVAGTGVVAFAVSHAGKKTRTMGFGPAFGDPGSGHRLGTRALAATARALDGRSDGSVRRETSDVADSDDARVCARREGESIARAVLTKLGFDVTTRTEEGDEVDVFDAACQKTRDARREDLTRWAYGEGPAPAWDRVASLAPIIFDEYKRGNVTAVGIVNESASALADNAVVAIERAHEDESVVSGSKKPPFVVALAGGLFEDGSPDGYRALVEGAIERILKARKLEMDVEFYDDPATGKHGDIGGPLKGAVKMAIRSFEAWRRRVPDADLF